MGETMNKYPMNDVPPLTERGARVALPERVGAGQWFEAAVSLSASFSEQVCGGNWRWRARMDSGDGTVFFTLKEAVSGDADARTFRNEGEWNAGTSGSTERWTIKLTRAGKYCIRFELIDPSDIVAAAESIEVLAEPCFENLGSQVFNQLIMKARFGKEDGRDVAYTVLAGETALLAVIDVKTEESIKQFPLEGSSGAWGIAVATDGKVYIGTFGAANLYCYDPGQNEVTNLGDPAEAAGMRRTTQFFEMVPGPDGNVFGGVYPSGSVWEYRLDIGFVNYGTIYPETEYPRTVAYDFEEDIVYVGGGGPRAYLIRLDLKTGEKTNVLPETISAQYSFCYDLNIEGEHLFMRLDPDAGFIVLNKQTFGLLFDGEQMHSREVSPRSPYEDSVYLTKDGLLRIYDLKENRLSPVLLNGDPIDLGFPIIGCTFVELEDPEYPGFTLVGFIGNQGGLFFKYNLPKQTLKQTSIPLPKQAFGLHGLAEGPRGTICSAGFLQGGVGRFDPETRTSFSNPFSQPEGIVHIGDKFFFGIYPGARIFEYDINEPWKRLGPDATVRLKFELKTHYEQDRPFAMLAVPEEGFIFIGTIPYYTKHGGALTVYEPSEGEPVYDVFRNIIPDHSIVSLAYRDGLLYGGSSFRGGLGGIDKPDDARLFVFDVSTRRKVFETVPFPGKGAITELMFGPDGLLWGFAMGTFFVFDPTERKIVHQDEAFPEAFGTWRDAHMRISRHDGHVYGTINGKFFRIDRDTRAITMLREKAARLAQDHYGNMYFVDYVDMWRYTVEDNTVPVSGVKLSVQEVRLSVGQLFPLHAEVRPEFATRSAVSWASSNRAVADVGPTGIVRAVGTGAAFITVATEDGGLSASAKIVVY
jgi:hypothetical protein